MDGHDYGIVKPGFGGRWSWPITAMEPGDFFHVEHSDKAPQDVRKVVKVRASQEGKFVSIRQDSPLMAGATLVECVPPPEQRVAQAGGDAVMEYASAQGKLDRHYVGVNLDKLNSMKIEFWEEDFLEGKRYCETTLKRIVFTMARFTIGALLKSNGVLFMRLPDKATPGQWDVMFEEWDRERLDWARKELNEQQEKMDRQSEERAKFDKGAGAKLMNLAEKNKRENALKDVMS